MYKACFHKSLLINFGAWWWLKYKTNHSNIYFQNFHHSGKLNENVESHFVKILWHVFTFPYCWQWNDKTNVLSPKWKHNTARWHCESLWKSITEIKQNIVNNGRKKQFENTMNFSQNFNVKYETFLATLNWILQIINRKFWSTRLLDYIRNWIQLLFGWNKRYKSRNVSIYLLSEILHIIYPKHKYCLETKNIL